MTSGVRPSWWLKIDRAKQHFREFELEAKRYSDRRSYRAERVGYRKNNRQHWRYVLRITEQPPRTLSPILGDAFHNLRSALDHIAAALVPSERRSHSQFPILTVDLWALNEVGEFVVTDDQPRERFERCVRGMPPEAIAKLLELQPYARYPDRPEGFPISLIQRFDNADKHSRLIAFASGLSLITLEIQAGKLGAPIHLPYAALVNDRSVYEDGAELFNDEAAPFGDPQNGVQVQIRGTPEITLKVGSGDIHIPAATAFSQCIVIVTVALEALELYVDPNSR
jgi:hypothetical protein